MSDVIKKKYYMVLKIDEYSNIIPDEEKKKKQNQCSPVRDIGDHGIKSSIH